MIFVGIDVAKDKHDCFITNSDGEVLFKAFTISNNLDGFNDLYQKITSVMENVNSDTGYQKYQMAVFTTAYGNFRFAKLYPTQDTAAFQESHADFFAYSHGSFQTMVYDNMKVAVRRFVGLTEKEPTIALTELSIYYGFKYRFCNIRRGNEKGHVERSVEYVRRKVFSFYTVMPELTIS